MNSLSCCLLPQRAVLRLDGPDRVEFLQGLISNDVRKVRPDHALWAAMLTPQGKFLFDMFLIADGESLLLEVEAARAEALVKKLSLYKLRSKISISRAEGWRVFALLPPEQAPVGTGIAFTDPRDAALGQHWLLPPDTPLPAGVQELDFAVWDNARITLGLPDGSRDLVPEQALLLENRFEVLNGVDFDKGCYMGQELTARTKYRALIRKSLFPVRASDGTTPLPDPGTPILSGEDEVGTMRSHCGSIGLATLRLEALPQAPFTAAGVSLEPCAGFAPPV